MSILLPLQLSLEAVNARLVEKTRELNVFQIENEKLKVHTYVGLSPPPAVCLFPSCTVCCQCVCECVSFPCN